MSIIEYRLQHFTAIILPLRLPLVRGFNRCQCFANIIICQVFQAMLRHPLVHHGAPWYAMSGEGLVIHLGQLTPPAESATENASSSRVQPCPAVSGRSVNGVCHAAAQILHILPQILAANRLDAQRRRANLARNKEAVDDGVAKPTTMWQQSSSLFKLQQQQSFCHTGHPQTPQAAQVATPFQGRTLLKYIWSASGKDGSTSSWDFKLPLAKQLIPDIERTCEEWRKTNTVG